MIPKKCPECGATPFITFLRGQVARAGRAWYWPFKKRPRWAVICHDCKEIVGYEWPKIIDIWGLKHLPEWERRDVVKRMQGGVPEKELTRKDGP